MEGQKHLRGKGNGACTYFRERDVLQSLVPIHRGNWRRTLMITRDCETVWTRGLTDTGAEQR